MTLGPDLDYRRGLLGQGSFLSVTWVQNFRTSPVKRGVWVLENILGTPPPEPPPNVPPLEDTTGGSDKDSDAARADDAASEESSRVPVATSSWTRSVSRSKTSMPTRKWRTKQGGDGGIPIDASVELWDGTQVNGPVELRQALLRYSPQFVRMITEKLMTYALGRGVEYYDMPVIRSIVTDADKNQQQVLVDRDGHRQERASSR